MQNPFKFITPGAGGGAYGGRPMRRVLTGVAAGLLLGGAGCRHCCGDRPRLFDSYRDDATRNRDPDCRENCPPARGASNPRLGTPLTGSSMSSSGAAGYPLLPTYSAPVMTIPAPANLLPMPGGGASPPADSFLTPPTPAAPGTALLPPPSTRPAGR